MIDSEIGYKELGRNHPTNTHNKRLLIRTSHTCHRRGAAGRNQQVEEYKHTHTHLHKHTNTHTHTHIPAAISKELQSQFLINFSFDVLLIALVNGRHALY